MELLSKRKRKKANATYHECSLCKGLHPRVRKAHGYILEQLLYYSDTNKSLRGKSRFWVDHYYEELVDFERKMKSYSDTRYARDQRRREGKWW